MQSITLCFLPARQNLAGIEWMINRRNKNKSEKPRTVSVHFSVQCNMLISAGWKPSVFLKRLVRSCRMHRKAHPRWDLHWHILTVNLDNRLQKCMIWNLTSLLGWWVHVKCYPGTESFRRSARKIEQSVSKPFETYTDTSWQSIWKTGDKTDLKSNVATRLMGVKCYPGTEPLRRSWVDFFIYCTDTCRKVNTVFE